MINGLPYYGQHRDYSDKLLGRCIKIVSPLNQNQNQHTLEWGIRVKLSELKFPSELSNHLGSLQTLQKQ